MSPNLRVEASIYQETRTVATRAKDATVRLLDRTDLSEGGSGVLISHAGRILIATAAHVVRPLHELVIVPRPPRQEEVALKLVIRDEILDAAILEVAPNAPSACLACLENRALSMNHLGDYSDEGDVFIVGFPGEYFYRIGETANAIAAYTYQGRIVPITEWGQLSPEEPFEPTVDLVMRCPRRVGKWHHDLNDCFPKPPFEASPKELSGMSGCGMWVFGAHVTTSGIWSAAPVLVGILISEKVSEGWARARRSCLWRSLIQDHVR